MGSGDHSLPRLTLSTTQSSTPSAILNTELLSRRNFHALHANPKMTTLMLDQPTPLRLNTREIRECLIYDNISCRSCFKFYFFYALHLLFEFVIISHLHQ